MRSPPEQEMRPLSHDALRVKLISTCRRRQPADSGRRLRWPADIVDGPEWPGDATILPKHLSVISKSLRLVALSNYAESE